MGYPLYLLFAAMASLACLANLACNIMSWLRIAPHGGLLLAAKYAVCLLIILLLPHSRRNLLKDLPAWMRWAVVCLGVYAILNTTHVMICLAQHPKEEYLPSLNVRVISGIWMYFYGFVAGSLVALAREVKDKSTPDANTNAEETGIQ